MGIRINFMYEGKNGERVAQQTPLHKRLTTTFKGMPPQVNYTRPHFTLEQDFPTEAQNIHYQRHLILPYKSAQNMCRQGIDPAHIIPRKSGEYISADLLLAMIGIPSLGSEEASISWENNKIEFIFENGEPRGTQGHIQKSLDQEVKEIIYQMIPGECWNEDFTGQASRIMRPYVPQVTPKEIVSFFELLTKKESSQTKTILQKVK